VLIVPSGDLHIFLSSKPSTDELGATFSTAKH
jgi:hypothetical protein